MCGRYGLWAQPADLEQRFGEVGVENVLGKRFNIAPNSDVPIVRNDEPNVVNQAEWGFVAPWDSEKRLINARAETVAEKQTFKDAFANHRCLVPASAYYEWQAQPRGSKQPYLIHRADGEPFAFAGLWKPANGYEKPTCTILTTEPSESIDHIHDRMPVMLEPDNEADWLAGGDLDELRELIGPYPSERLETYPISTKVNNPEYDRPDVIEPIELGDQSGLDEFA
jgi:putative SOS response-associated peptidase YedK